MTPVQALLMASAGAALTGLAVTLFGVREAILDLHALLAERITDGRRLIARRGVEAEVARAAAFLLFVVTALSVAVGTPREAVVTPFRYAGNIAYFIAQVLLTLDAARNLRARRDLLELHHADDLADPVRE